MTKDSYLNQIQKIKKQIAHHPKKALEELEKLYQWKPVRQQWYLAKAEAMLKLAYPYQEIQSVLAEKFNLESIAEETKMFFDISGRLIEDDCHIAKTRYEFLTALYTYLLEQTDSALESLKQYYLTLSQVRSRLLEHDDTMENVTSLADQYYITDNLNLYLLLLLYANKLVSECKIPIVDWVEEQPNMGYLIERLSDPMQSTFIVIESSHEDSVDCQIAAEILSKLEKRVFLIKLPIECPIKNDVDMEDTLSVSLENMQEYVNLTVIYPVALIQDGEWLEDNRDYIIRYIIDAFSENHLATILSSGDMFDRLDGSKLLQKKFQRLSHFKSDYLNRNIEFGWAGDYMSYISQIYGFDAWTELSQPAKYDFSIVVPARNSANTLRSTLQTCLNQRFTGNYEIVLSDNSVAGNTEVYNLWKELNDERIKYFRAPRDLPLAKSFEFAFLKAKGRFIFSIGADDAVLPWALEVLHDALKHIPGDEIVVWDRGFYAWPGFNKGQQHQFVVPGHYQKNNIKIERIAGKATLNQVIHDPNIMYGLPLLYINSGFRRSYFQTLLYKTGRLWDGNAQDIYMGIVNLSINNSFPAIRYPLTIAGMSSASIGAQSQKTITSDAELTQLQNMKLKNVGVYSQFSVERLLPRYPTDRWSLYCGILRTIALGVQLPDILEQLDWKKVFELLVEQLSIEDIQIDKKLNMLRYSASLIRAEIAEYVEKEICARVFTPRIIEKYSYDGMKYYQEGFTDNGGLVLDASKFGVSNIYEAVQLFEKIVAL
ncbi:glycosyltransferase family 2 protein [Lutispora sp.]|uniref:glycosyltransferase family 2 protein n=1 Tax=Lutispora sp. TaxID=2828727 RepID=UPI002B206087|nr:glycosyltransferase [Lutispora sp.]MEA4962854.1 glycosyltransferase [Lutispora sp.]